MVAQASPTSSIKHPLSPAQEAELKLFEDTIRSLESGALDSDDGSFHILFCRRESGGPAHSFAASTVRIEIVRHARNLSTMESDQAMGAEGVAI